MAAIANEIDRILQAAASRNQPDPSHTFLLATSAPGGFKIAADGSATPATITITAVRFGITGAVAFTANDAATLHAAGADAITLSAADMPDDLTTITARITEDGVETVRTIDVQKVRDGTGGSTTYTWVKYADSAAGAGLSDDPTGKSYIGLAYNKPTAVESTDPTDYAWSLIKGADGVGQPGSSLYTWIKYSDNADGSGLYDIPTAATVYIGIAVNKATAVESTNPADYTWSRFKGDQGVPGTGQRGPGWFYWAGNAWSDAAAEAATPGDTQIDDQVTISNGTVSYTKRWNGSAWVVPGAYMDGSLFVEKSINAAKINVNGLEVRAPDGTMILDGSGLRYAYVPDTAKNNLVDLSKWRQFTRPDWPVNGEGNAIFPCAPGGTPDLPWAIPGPKGGNDLVWYCQEQTGDSGPGGGWDAPGTLHLDPAKTYRFAIPVRRLSGGGYAYWGVTANTVCTLNTDQPHGNPYFVDQQLLPATDRWYLLVGFIYPAGSTGNTHDGAGLWDCKTGAKVSAGTNYCFAAYQNGVTGHRAYQYYAPLNSEQLFGRPMVNLVDGTEPSLREYFDASALLNSQQQWDDILGTNKPENGATKGAPAGTFVGGTEAQTLQSWAAQGANAYGQIPGLNTAIGQRLRKDAADTLSGQIALQSQYALLVGDANNGVWMGSGGIFMVQGGVVKASMPISGNPTYAGQLIAAFGSFGAVSIAAGGYLGLQAAAYGEVGVWFGFVGGQPKFSIVAANGAKLLFDPTQPDPLQVINAKVSNPTMDAFSATLSGNAGGSYPNGSATYGTLTANPIGGKLPYSFRWTLTLVLKAGNAGNMVIDSTTSQSASFSGSGSNATLDYNVTCIVTDANGRTVTLGQEIVANHGAPP